MGRPLKTSITIQFMTLFVVRICNVLSSFVCPLPSVLCFLSSVLCPLSPVLSPRSSALCPLPFVLYPLSSTLCTFSSVVFPLFLILCPLFSALCFLKKHRSQSKRIELPHKTTNRLPKWTANVFQGATCSMVLRTNIFLTKHKKVLPNWPMGHETM